MPRKIIELRKEISGSNVDWFCVEGVNVILSTQTYEEQKKHCIKISSFQPGDLYITSDLVITQAFLDYFNGFGSSNIVFNRFADDKSQLFYIILLKDNTALIVLKSKHKKIEIIPIDIDLRILSLSQLEDSVINLSRFTVMAVEDDKCLVALDISNTVEKTLDDYSESYTNGYFIQIQLTVECSLFLYDSILLGAFSNKAFRNFENGESVDIQTNKLAIPQKRLLIDILFNHINIEDISVIKYLT